MTLIAGSVKSTLQVFSGALTASYQATTAVDTVFCNQIIVYVNVTDYGTLATVEFKLQASIDGGTTWFDVPRKNTPTTTGNENIALIKTDVAQLTAADLPKALPFPCLYPLVRGAIKGTGTPGTAAATVSMSVGSA